MGQFGKLYRLALASSVCFGAFSGLSWGQVPPAGSPLPRVQAPSLPAARPVVDAPLLPPSGQEVPNRPVRVTSAVIEGATVFPAADLSPSLDNLIGPATPLPQVDAARRGILQLYRDQGYVLTTVTAKLDAAGALRFVVVEGRIAAVKLDGDIGPAGVQVLRFLDNLVDGQPIRSDRMERYLLLAQDVPGITLRAVIDPSTDTPGALTLIAQVSRKSIGGSVSADNRAFHQTGPNEFLGVLDFNSFTEFGEKTQASFYHTFPNSQNFGQISSEFFVGGSGLKLKIYAGYGLVAPTGTLAASNYQGTTTVFGGQVSYPVIRSRQQTLNLFFGLDALESRVSIGTPSVRASADELRVLRLGEEYVLSDVLLGADRSAFNTALMRVSQGIRALGAATTGTAASTPRQHERSDFTKINFELTRTQTLFAPWDGASVALMGLVTGQWSNDILPPAEQFYLGGARYTRGYYSGQVPGDKAIAATAELQLNTTITVPALVEDPEVSTQFYVFYDWGETWQNVTADFSTKVASAGGGARIQLTRYVELDLEALGRFNVYPSGGQNTGVSSINGLGLYWRLLGRF